MPNALVQCSTYAHTLSLENAAVIMVEWWLPLKGSVESKNKENDVAQLSLFFLWVALVTMYKNTKACIEYTK